MDRRTIIAVVLCVIVITVGMTIQTTFFSPTITEQQENQTEIFNEDNSLASTKEGAFKAIGNSPSSSQFVIESGAFIITFDPVGGTISSMKTKDHLDDDEPIELIFKDPDDVNAFMLYWGNNKDNMIDDTFSYNIESRTLPNGKSINQVTFNRDFEEIQSGKVFTIEKKFAIPENEEYLIQFAVTIKTQDGSVIPLNYDGNMYSLSIGPQIGPSFESLSGNYEYRRVIYKQENKGGRKNAGFRNGFFEYSKNPVDWVGLTGKYFAFLLIPESDSIVSSISACEVQNNSETLPQTDTVYITRKADNTSSITDLYSFYAGPQLAKTLKIYDKASDNTFGLADKNLKKALDVSWLSWLETFLKWILEAFYFVIPNYGVAIILLTILVKLCLVPISKKGMDSTAKMSALTPKIEEIKANYPNNPEEQNRLIAKLYQDEKINPMGSCIPMLIQFPIFIALYGLLNKNFELRGAMFIPGWIPDLSIPDTIATLPFSLPFLGPQIHLLPIIYTVSMIFSMKITQTANTAQGQKGMMWFMTYGMPIIFFFVMYNAPSGLLVYWTITNFISIGSQIWTNHKKGSLYKEEFMKKEAEKKAKKKGKRK